MLTAHLTGKLVCVCVFTLTGKLQPQSADRDSNEDADDSDIVIHEDDFYSALSRLVPSLSAAEQKRYDSLQNMFTQRRHGNQHASSSSSQ